MSSPTSPKATRGAEVNAFFTEEGLKLRIYLEIATNTPSEEVLPLSSIVHFDPVQP